MKIPTLLIILGLVGFATTASADIAPTAIAKLEWPFNMGEKTEDLGELPADFELDTTENRDGARVGIRYSNLDVLWVPLTWNHEHVVYRENSPLDTLDEQEVDVLEAKMGTSLGGGFWLQFGNWLVLALGLGGGGAKTRSMVKKRRQRKLAAAKGGPSGINPKLHWSDDGKGGGRA